MTALLLAASLLAQTDDAAARARVEALIARGRFFDAHAHCIVGRTLASTAEGRTWYAIRDAYSLWMLGDPEAAFDELSVDPREIGPRDREVLAFAAAWLRFRGGDPEALPRWIQGGPGEDLRTRAALFVEVLQGREPPMPAPLQPLARELRNQPSISPAVTGLLSAVLPGAGHARLGLWSDAALTFGLNAVSIGATVELARASLVMPAIAAGLVASLFYVGGIVSSASIARERNEAERAKRIAAVERALFPELPASDAVPEHRRAR